MPPVTFGGRTGLLWETESAQSSPPSSGLAAPCGVAHVPWTGEQGTHMPPLGDLALGSLSSAATCAERGGGAKGLLQRFGALTSMSR